jgi:alkylation response protein AidB-like acyl-CoA dehydrogenase
VDAILEEAAKLCAQEIAPLNRSGDEEGVIRTEDAKIVTPKGFKEAYQHFAEGGWQALGGDPEYGGMGMPKQLTVLIEEMLYGANSSFALYPALTAGACLAMWAHATEALKQRFLPNLYEGRWAGSMCLTEPHCGTDLGMIRTKAELDKPDAEGTETYLISGTKIFITGGEHDLNENIIHLVLAKLPDAPEGSRGISLFLVPKIWVDEQGQLQKPNNVICGSIEHKMGIKASATCEMNFDQARGYLIGEPHKGLPAMFTMMNYERLSIGLQGIGCGEHSYQTALAYAKERIQGRNPLGVASPDQAADPIMVHPDVRRMLLTMRAFNEGGRAFSQYAALYLDAAKYAQNPEERAKGEAMLALLTPVCKAFFTDKGLDMTVIGQQVLGGHGYICEWGQEQLVRDARIAQIYEGTNGIQALDLMGRKVVANQGAFYQIFSNDVHAFVESVALDSAIRPFSTALGEALTALDHVTTRIIERAQKNPCEVGAASVEYLQAFGLVAYGFMWVKMAEVAFAQVNGAESDFYKGKVAVTKFYFAKCLPHLEGLIKSIDAGADVLYSLNEEQF